MFVSLLLQVVKLMPVELLKECLPDTVPGLLTVEWMSISCCQCIVGRHFLSDDDCNVSHNRAHLNLVAFPTTP